MPGQVANITFRVLDAGQYVLLARHSGSVEWIAEVGAACQPRYAAGGGNAGCVIASILAIDAINDARRDFEDANKALRDFGFSEVPKFGRVPAMRPPRTSIEQENLFAELFARSLRGNDDEMVQKLQFQALAALDQHVSPEAELAAKMARIRQHIPSQQALTEHRALELASRCLVLRLKSHVPAAIYADANLRRPIAISDKRLYKQPIYIPPFLGSAAMALGPDSVDGTLSESLWSIDSVVPQTLNLIRAYWRGVHELRGLGDDDRECLAHLESRLSLFLPAGTDLMTALDQEAQAFYEHVTNVWVLATAILGMDGMTPPEVWQATRTLPVELRDEISTNVATINDYATGLQNGRARVRKWLLSGLSPLRIDFRGNFVHIREGSRVAEWVNQRFVHDVNFDGIEVPLLPNRASKELAALIHEPNRYKRELRSSALRSAIGLTPAMNGVVKSDDLWFVIRQAEGELVQYELRLQTDAQSVANAGEAAGGRYSALEHEYDDGRVYVGQPATVVQRYAQPLTYIAAGERVFLARAMWEELIEIEISANALDVSGIFPGAWLSIRVPDSVPLPLSLVQKQAIVERGTPQVDQWLEQMRVKFVAAWYRAEVVSREPIYLEPRGWRDRPASWRFKLNMTLPEEYRRVRVDSLQPTEDTQTLLEQLGFRIEAVAGTTVIHLDARPLVDFEVYASQLELAAANHPGQPPLEL